MPAGFFALKDAGTHASGWPIAIVGERDGATMVLVPGATFTLGRDNAARNEGPSRSVKLGTFYMDQHEVINAQFDRYRRAAHQASANEKGDSGDSDPNRPVVMVTHGEAAAYAAWAGKALPTEAQWELAARTTDGRLHPWGADPPSWEKHREARQVDPVFSFLRDMSPYGAFDLAGNVWEWTADGYDIKMYQSIKNGQANPTGPTRAAERSVRGGSKDWLSTWRAGVKPETRLPYLGFRCVLSVEDLPQGQAPGQGKAARGPIPF